MTEPSTGPAGPGAMLRAAREKQGLHIAALAAAIKVSPRKLDALENDRWQELPDATFARALAQTVCRTLKIDARAVLDKLPTASHLSLDAGDAGLNAPFRDRPGREEPGLPLGAVRPMVWAALVLMLAAVAVYFMPPGLFNRIAAPTVSVATVATPPALPAAAIAPVVAPVPAAAASEAAPLASAAAPAGMASAATTAGETVFSAPPVSAAGGAAADAAPAGLVQLRTSEASWIDVRDARGTPLLSRTVMPGESVSLDGALPIRLTIGNAAATQLGFRGQSVELGDRTRDNVARVELR